MTKKRKIILPNGSEADQVEGVSTERSIEREEEEQKYTPVIVKRIDEATRHPDDTLENAIREGIEQLDRPSFSLFLSSAAAGMTVGFSAMAVAVVTAMMLPHESPLLTRIASALVYPVGFVVCIMSGAQLFTEHTATAVYPVLDRRRTTGLLLRLWALVVCGNLLGTAIIAWLLMSVDDVVGARAGYIAIGEHLTHYSAVALLTSAVLAGWLMALGAWLVMATPPDISQICSIFMVTFIIGLGGLHHSIAGAAEMFTAYLISDEFSVRQVVRFVAVALFGNLIGGSVFVGVLNYAHIRQTQAAAGPASGILDAGDAEEE